MEQKQYIFWPWWLKIYFLPLCTAFSNSRSITYNFIFNWYLWKTLQFLSVTYFRVFSLSKHRIYIPSAQLSLYAFEEHANGAFAGIVFKTNRKLSVNFYITLQLFCQKSLWQYLKLCKSSVFNLAGSRQWPIKLS